MEESTDVRTDESAIISAHARWDERWRRAAGSLRQPHHDCANQRINCRRRRDRGAYHGRRRDRCGRTYCWRR
jgi:hypothetical protein